MTDPTDTGEHDPQPGPYATAAPAYWAAGWRGVLPVPAGRKTPVPAGYTGSRGVDPSGPDVYAWTEGPEGAGNIALRLPRDVIGVDVDAYDGKPARLVLDELERRLGALPATWRTTSRDDGASGIRLYKVPKGLRWPGALGPGIDTIRWDHRYAVAWPSIHPGGGTYRWITPDGLISAAAVPPLADLPDLPETWVTHFTGGELAGEKAHADTTDASARQWLAERSSGAMCGPMRKEAGSFTKRAVEGSRHDAVLRATNRVLFLAGGGHAGAGEALSQLRTEFLAAVAGDRPPGAAEAEWDRQLLGGIREAVPHFDGPNPDSCNDNNPDLNDLILKDNPWQLTQTETSDDPKSSTTSASPAIETTTSTTTSLTSGPTTSCSSSAPKGTSGPERDTTLAADSLSPTAESGSSPSDTSDQPDAPSAQPSDPATWARVDLSPYLDGSYEPPVAKYLTRTDGVSLLYPGLVHSIHGESESGKSFIVQAEAARIIGDGGTVLFIDFESDPGSISERMLLLGVPPNEINERFHYVNPAAHPGTELERPAWVEMLGGSYDLAVIDGVTDSLSVFDLDSNGNDDITKWMRTLPKQIAARTGAAVVIIDHVVKDKENRGRFAVGGQAKMNGLTGPAFSIDVVTPIGRGLKGELKLRVGKDRAGWLRAQCGPMDKDRMQDAAIITVDSTVGDPVVTLRPPALTVITRGTLPDPTRFTGLMEKVSRLLEQADGPMSGNQVVDLIPGTKSRVKEALATLVGEGYVSVKSGPNRSMLHSHMREYRQRLDPKSDLYERVENLANNPSGSGGSEWVGSGSPTHSGQWVGGPPTPKGGPTHPTHSPEPEKTASGSDPVELAPGATCRHCGNDISLALKARRARCPWCEESIQ